MKTFLLTFLFFPFLLCAGYLPFAEPMRKMVSTSVRKFYQGNRVYEITVGNNQELYVLPETSLDYSKRLFVFPKGTTIVYEPSTHSFKIVDKSEVPYLSPTNKVWTAPHDQRMSFSKTGLALKLNPGQFAFEDNRARVTIVDITHHMGIFVHEDETMLLRKDSTSSLVNTLQLPALNPEKLPMDANAPVYRTAEDAVNHRNPMYLTPPQGEKEEEQGRVTYLPPPPPFPKGAKAERGDGYRGEFDVYDKYYDKDEDLLAEMGQVNPPEVTPLKDRLVQNPKAESLLPPSNSHALPRINAKDYILAQRDDENRGYAYAYRILYSDREDLNHTQIEKELSKNPQLELFMNYYGAALKRARVVLPPKKFGDMMGFFVNGEADPSYRNAIEGLALDLIKRERPDFWKSFFKDKDTHSGNS